MVAAAALHVVGWDALRRCLRRHSDHRWRGALADRLRHRVLHAASTPHEAVCWVVEPVARKTDIQQN